MTPFALLLLAVLAPNGAPPPTPASVVGPDECGECHEAAHEVWSRTAHARGWTELSRSDAARALAERLGIRRIKRDERCTSCHFLSAELGGQVRPIAGVSCESCHGAGGEWLDVHWDFGPGAGSAAEETPEHRAERLAACDRLGMARPGRLAALGETCYGCHLIADPELIAAGHPAPGPFDLALKTQGEIRHNFVRGEGANAPATRERLRLLHAVGRLLDWSATLRALSAAGEGSEAQRSLAARSAELRVLVEALQARSPRPELAAALEAAPDAEAVGAAAQALSAASDGSDLAGLDGLVELSEPR